MSMCSDLEVSLLAAEICAAVTGIGAPSKSFRNGMPSISKKVGARSVCVVTVSTTYNPVSVRKAKKVNSAYLPGRHPGSTDNQRDYVVLLDWARLAWLESVLPDVESVVSRVDNVRRIQKARGVEPGDHVANHLVDPSEELQARDIEGVVVVDVVLVQLWEVPDPRSATERPISCRTHNARLYLPGHIRIKVGCTRHLFVEERTVPFSLGLRWGDISVLNLRIGEIDEYLGVRRDRGDSEEKGHVLLDRVVEEGVRMVIIDI
jgi:hypothetical protein